MGCECKYYYDLSAKQWWQLDDSLPDWTPLSRDRVIELQLDSRLGGLGIKQLLGSEPDCSASTQAEPKPAGDPGDEAHSEPRAGFISPGLGVSASPSSLEDANLHAKDAAGLDCSKEGEDEMGRGPSCILPGTGDPAGNAVDGARSEGRSQGRKLSYVREAARRLTYKEPGGFSGCIKAIADTRNAMLKDGRRDLIQ